jgi:hypothetical protein
METARGRWFLAEYARRNRTADTELLLKAIERLQNVVAGEENRGELDEMRASLLDMAASIARLRRDLFAEDGTAQDGRGAPQELDAIVTETEQATHKILRIGERVQEIAWSLREQGVRASICDALDASATEIFAACSFQDLTGQKIARVVALLRMIEERLDTVIDHNGLDDLVLRNAPTGMKREKERLEERAAEDCNEMMERAGKAVSQHEVDALLMPPGQQSGEDQAQDGTPHHETVLIEIDGPELEVRDVEPDGAAGTGELPPAPDLPPEEETDTEIEANTAFPSADEKADVEDDLANFQRLSADLEAAAAPVKSRSQQLVAPGDIGFAGEESETASEPARHEKASPGAPATNAGNTARQASMEPEQPDSESHASVKAGGSRAGDPARTGWDAEFNRLSPAHRMALFS